DGDAFGGQVLGGVGGPVGLLVIDAGQDQDVCGGGTPAGSLQSRGGDVGLGAGQDGLHGARVSGVGVEADMGVDGGSHVGVSSVLPVAGAAGPATGLVGSYRVARVGRAACAAVVVGGPARVAGAARRCCGGVAPAARCQRVRTAAMSARARRAPATSWKGVFAESPAYASTRRPVCSAVASRERRRARSAQCSTDPAGSASMRRTSPGSRPWAGTPR